MKRRIIALLCSLMIVFSSMLVVNAGSASLTGRYEGFRYNGSLSLTSNLAQASLGLTALSDTQVLPEETYMPRISGIVVNENDELIYEIEASSAPSCSWTRDMSGRDPWYAYCYYYLADMQVGNRNVTVD